MQLIAGIRTRVSAFLSSRRSSASKRNLEHQVKQFMEIADGHKEAGLPAGHPYYQKLLVKVNALIEQFLVNQKSLGFDATYDDVAMGMPKLRELNQLANPSQAGQSKAIQIASASAVGFAIAYVFGATVLALGHNWYLILTHYVTTHFS